MTGKATWLGALLATSVAYAQTDVLTSHYDQARTGQNLNESTLTAANVNAAAFGKAYAFAVDGYVYAQPLYKSNLSLPGKGTFNVVFVATQHGSVYALDAATATPLWWRTFVDPTLGLTSRTTNPSLEDIVPEVSITSTPVIDPASGTLYVVAETVQSGSPAYYYLHALDITSGADKVTPARIQASLGAKPLTLDAGTSQQRPGLTLSNGVVYIGFGSSGDNFPWVGWLLGYNATTLAQVTVFCLSPSGAQGSGLWSTGEAPPVDASGNLFIVTGNGYFSPNNSWGDSFLKLSTSGGLAVTDYFTPFNQTALANADLDVASAGFVLLPDSAGSAAHPHLLVGSGKDGEVYVVDRDNMGQFNGSYSTPNSQIVQWLPNAVGTVTLDPTAQPMTYAENSYTTPAYWQNGVYFCGVDDACKLFTLSTGLLSTSPASRTPTTFAYGGAQAIVTAASSSATSGIMWAVERDTTNNITTLHAYDATNLANEFYNANQAAGQRDQGGIPVKFVVPTIANGMVFVGAAYELDVYGLLATNLPRLSAPTFSPTPGSYLGSQTVTISASAGATIYYTLDGSVPTLGSAVYSAPITVSSTTTVNAIAVQSGHVTSPVGTATYTLSPMQIAFVQGTYRTPQSPQASVAVSFTAAQSAGNLNVVAVGWDGPAISVTGVTDSNGNTYAPAFTTPTVESGVAAQTVYYAKNIRSGPDTVTVAFSAAATFPDVRIAEYSGLDTTSPLDVAVGATGTGVSASSGAITTNLANELIVGADYVQSGTTGAGAGFTARMITVPAGNILEDRTVTATGSYSADAPLSPSAGWIMQMVTFQAAIAGGGTGPSAPSNLTASAAGSQAINLSWGASTESGGTISRYLIERCQGAGCTNFIQVGTSTTTSFANSGLAPSTSYSYRVRAQDNTNHLGPYSGSATATTTAPSPTAPTSLAAVAAGSVQINLTWGAATEVGGTISQYRIERCQGSGCSTFTQIGTSSSLAFSDTGLIGSTSYSYRVRAADASGTTGPYSNIASATTAAPTVTAPGSLTANAVSSVQINLAWTAATETGGTISQYRIERCEGSGCGNFAQIGTSTTLAFSDTGLSGSTSYSYRVRAADASGNTGPYSNVASTTTAAPNITAPGTLTASAVSSVQINLTWGAATETGGTISQYRIERCKGSGCGNFAQIGTSATLAFSDAGLSGSTTYSYRVRAADASGNTGPYSNVASTTTAAPNITAPGTLTASAVSSVQINLTWGAATETGGTISQYRIERCQGSGCSTFTQIGTSTTFAFSDTGLSGSTTYSYRVRAADALGSTGPYSNVAGATTATPTLTAPPSLTATAAGPSQVNLGWTAASEIGGTLSEYRIERCQGSGCSTFTQIGTSRSLAYSDTGLSSSTTYSYRVRAADALGNTGPYSNVANATTAAPTITAPGNLTASAASGSQIDLAWTAASETGGTVSAYLIERCQGSGCGSFSQVASTAGTSYTDTGLTSSASYSYRVRATDTGGNQGPYSNTASVATSAVVVVSGRSSGGGAIDWLTLGGLLGSLIAGWRSRRTPAGMPSA